MTSPRNNGRRVRLTCRVCDPPSTVEVPAEAADHEWARHYAREHGNTTTPEQMERLRRTQGVQPLTD